MQSKNYDGTLGEIEPFNSKKLETLLSDEKVESVNVFKIPKNTTITEIRRLKRLQKMNENEKEKR